MNIRKATTQDFEAIWPIFKEIIKLGDTYAYDRNTSKEQAFVIWVDLPEYTFVVEEDGVILGTYFIKTNQAGPGDHVCNCGYMVAFEARGRGVGSNMCIHSQRFAMKLGYKAMQFNFVATSNTGAIRLWEKLGFETVGRLPLAFKHPATGYIDALIMYKCLDIRLIEETSSP